MRRTLLEFFLLTDRVVVICVRPLVVVRRSAATVSSDFMVRYRKCSRLPAWRPPTSPPNRSGGKNQKRARSVEGLLETAPEVVPEPQLHASQMQMKKAKSLEEYLDACGDVDDCAEDRGSIASASAGDAATNKRNFVDKCINKVKSLMTAGKKTDSK
ncbi:Hypothetical protein CINCED_3A006548 [Cinara cedri]|uniref:Uncharacterized protein n=1 Tax=Cinara cedri TaxID=506608 RepID=A0A5E4MBD1_9HEMI|nr:Hypothetical protein CINCED_3A006548 [Cinara cedri]